MAVTVDKPTVTIALDHQAASDLYTIIGHLSPKVFEEIFGLNYEDNLCHIAAACLLLESETDPMNSPIIDANRIMLDYLYNVS